MDLTNVRELFRNREEYLGKQVTIGGWVRSNRNSKNFGFIVVNDGTFFEPVQVVYGDGLDNFDEILGQIEDLDRKRNGSSDRRIQIHSYTTERRSWNSSDKEQRWRRYSNI